jgi:hypothetical protein
MLHRLTLRVLPRLALAVTQDEVRRRKRVVMLLPGLAAFALYRLAHWLLPLSDPYVLLAVSGALSAATALVCYRYGRGGAWPDLCREDGARRLGWVVGWVGFVYGVQLALMVLALLKIVVRYDFLAHPDGPAMMAVIIAATSVARDAFEIGHVRRLQRGGERVLTFPDGAAFRALLREQPGPSLRLTVVGGGLVLLAALAARVVEVGRTDLGQLIVVTLAAGSVTLAAYLADGRPGGWRAAAAVAGWGSCSGSGGGRAWPSPRPMTWRCRGRGCFSCGPGTGRRPRRRSPRCWSAASWPSTVVF